MDLEDFYNFFLKGIIIIIFILLLVIFIKFNTIKKKIKELEKNKNNIYNKFKILEKNYDTFIHLSTETFTFDGVYNFLLTYDTDIVNLNQCNFSNQLISYQSKLDFTYLNEPYNKLQNYYFHISNKYIETFDEKNYFGLCKEKFRIEKKIEYYEGSFGNSMYIGYFKRLEDKKDFIFVSMTQIYHDYHHDIRFKGVVQMIKTFKKHYPHLPYIITGDLNVQGHEEIFKNFLKDALICDVSKNLCTCNDLEGIASPDALIVSNKLYKKVEYKVDFLKGFTTQHYPLIANFYIEGNNEVINITNSGFKENLKNYIKNTKLIVHINKKSKFDILKHDTDKICERKEIKNFFQENKKAKKNMTN